MSLCLNIQLQTTTIEYCSNCNELQVQIEHSRESGRGLETHIFELFKCNFSIDSQHTITIVDTRIKKKNPFTLRITKSAGCDDEKWNEFLKLVYSFIK
jgi:hypothetical protein